MPIDVSHDEDLSGIALFQRGMASRATDMDTWSDDIVKQKQRALKNWEGGAADAFSRACSNVVSDLDEFSTSLKKFALEVGFFHDTLSVAHEGLDALLVEAKKVPLSVMTEDAGGVTTTTILEPGAPFPLDQPPPPSMTPAQQAQVADYNRRVRAYDDLAKRAAEQQHNRAKAHRTFRLACMQLKAPKRALVRLRPGPESLRGGADKDAPAQLNEKAPSAAGEQFEKWLEGSDAENAGGDEAKALLKALKALGIVDKFKDRLDLTSKTTEDFLAQWEFDSHDPMMSDNARVKRALYYAAERHPVEALSSTGWATLGKALGPIGSVLMGMGGKEAYDDAYEYYRAQIESTLDSYADDNNS